MGEGEKYRTGALPGCQLLCVGGTQGILGAEAVCVRDAGWDRAKSMGSGNIQTRGKLIFLSHSFLSNKIISTTPSSQGCRKD